MKSLDNSLDFSDYIDERTRGFTGREWVFKAIDLWLKQPAGSSCFLLTGEPGSGKSAIAARLAQVSDVLVPKIPKCESIKPGFLSAVHFCSARERQWINPHRFSESLALQLAARYPAYASALAEKSSDEKIHIKVQQRAGSIQKGGQQIGVNIAKLDVSRVSAEDAFMRVVRQPLEALYQDQPNLQVVILVDGLDETLVYTGEIGILPLLAQVDTWPQNVRLLLTSRQESRIESEFLYAEGLFISADQHNDRNDKDVRRYIKRQAAKEPLLAEQLARLSPERQKALMKTITRKAAGNFLYITFFLGEIATGKRELADLEGLPARLDGLYYQSLERLVKLGEKKWEQVYAPVFGALSVAQTRLSQAQLMNFSGLNEEDSWQALVDLEQFLQRGEPETDEVPVTYQLYHQSVSDFLAKQYLTLEKKRIPNRFYLPTETWHHRIADYYLKKFQSDWSQCDDYGLNHLPIHLAAAERIFELHDLLLNYRWLHTKFERLGIYTLLADYDIKVQIPVEMAEALQRVGQALRQGAHVLTMFPDQLAQQLLGRLLNNDRYQIIALCNDIRQQVPRPCLLPQTPSLRRSQDLLRVLVGHSDPVMSVAITADGRIVSASIDGLVKIWELASGRELRSFQAHMMSINAIKATPDGKLLISASSDNICKVWDLATGQLLHTLVGHTAAVNALAVTSDGRFVLSASDDETVKMWDLSNGQASATFTGHTNVVKAVAVTNKDQWGVSASNDGTIKVWDLVDGQELRSLLDDPYGIDALAVSDDGQAAVITPGKNTIQVWDLAGSQLKQTLQGHHFMIHTVAFTPDGLSLLSGAGSISGGDNTIKLWDLKTGELRRTFQDHTDQVNAIAVSLDGQLMISASSDHTLRLWEMGNVNRPAEEPITSDWVNDMTVTPDGQTIITASRNTLRVWGTENSAELRVLASRAEEVYIRSVAATPDGQSIVSGSTDGVVQVCDWKSGAERWTTLGHQGRVYAVAVTPDGRRVLSASQDKTIKLWDLANGVELATLSSHTEKVHALAVTPDGHFAVSGSADKTLKVWDLTTNTLVKTLEGHESTVYRLVITSDGYIISAGWDGTLRVWELASGTNVTTLQGHKQRVYDVDVLPGGQIAISAAKDQMLKVWELKSGRCLASFYADGPLRACVVLPASALIATGGNSGRVHVLEFVQ